MEKTMAGSGNRLIATMPPEDREYLVPFLEPCNLSLRFVMETANKPIEHVYFMESGIGSIVALGANGNRIEVGLFGRDGMSGTAIVYGSDSSPLETMVQLAGKGHRLPADRLRAALDASEVIRRTFSAYAFSLGVQTAHTALANGRQNLESRLARWLLMCHDRIDGDDIPLTHEYMSVMLGVRRAGVTLSTQTLESRGLIRATRNNIRVVDRAGLETLTDGFYGTPEQEYQRLVGSQL